MNINDLKFEPDCPSSVLDAAKAWLKNKKNAFMGTANFAVFSQNGGKNAYLANICHRMISTPNISDRCVVATEIAIGREAAGVANVSREPFLRWILQSPLGRFILNSDDFEFCRDYGIVISADIPAPLLQNICILSRHFRECPDSSFEHFNRWAPLYGGDIAYVLSFNSNISSGYVTESTPVQCIGGGHRVFKMPRSMETLNNFLSGEYGPSLTNLKDKHYRTNSYYNGGAGYCGHFVGYEFGKPWFSDDLLKTDPEFIRRLRESRGENKKESIIKNPFKRKAMPTIVQPWALTVKEIDEILLPYLAETGVLTPVVAESIIIQPTPEIAVCRVAA